MTHGRSTFPNVRRAAVETVSLAMAATHIAFDAEYDPQTPPILADPDRLQQMVCNLLSNAIEFTPEQGCVSPRLADAGARVEITVSGIDPKSPGRDPGATIRVRLPVRPVTKPADSAHDDAAASAHSSPVLRK